MGAEAPAEERQPHVVTEEIEIIPSPERERLVELYFPPIEEVEPEPE